MSTRSFLQSKNWAEFQKSLGRKIFEYDQDGIRAYIFRHDIPFGKNYLYIPHGPEVNFNAMIGGIKNPTANFIKWLKDLAKLEKSVFIKAEPLFDNVAQILAENKFKKSKKEIQPPKSLIIDLTKSEEELLGSMHYKTRYNIKIAERHNIHVDTSSGIDVFWKLIKKTSKRDKFSSHERKYYEKLFNFFQSGRDIDAKLFIAQHKEMPIAAAIILTYENSGYYLHGASDYKYRSFMAPYLLHWQIIKYLKIKGFENYNMWGVDAKHWPGVTRFKLGWLGSPKPGEGGGRLIEYPGSFDLTAKWLWHFLYKIYQHIKK